MMTNDFENQLDRIRVDLHEQTKDMTNSKAVRVTNENARKIAGQFGITIVKSAMSTSQENA